MQFGIAMFPTDTSIGIVELGCAPATAGFESLFVPEHTHMPFGAGSPGGQAAHVLDPFVALSAVAAVTTKLRLGTGICLVIERDPITLAKEVASLDFLSGGRVLFGIGGGWNQPEMLNHGARPALRWKLLRERVLAMKQIWREDEAEFHGEFVNFAPVWSRPKPVQQPHPAIIISGNGLGTFQRILEYGDGWMPSYGPIAAGRSAFGPGRRPSLPERVRELRRLAAAAGRGPLPITTYGAPPDPASIARLQQAGVDRCLFLLPPEPAATVLPLLERCAEITADFG